MLSSIGRRTILRVGACNTKVSNRIFLPIFIEHGNSGFHVKRRSPTIFSVSSVSRTYATTAKKRPRTKNASTKSTKTKKSVKSSRKPVKKSRIVAKKSRKVAKKTVKAKPKRVKKPLTEVQKRSRKLIELKSKALTPPEKLPNTARLIYMAEQLKGRPGAGMTSALTEFAAKWKNLSQSELQKYEERARRNKIVNEENFKTWLAKFTPDQIRIANNARRQITKYKISKRPWACIPDPRLPKRPVSSFLIYIKERHNSGEYSGVPFAEASKKIALEFKALSPSQRKKFEDIYLQERQRYLQEFKSAFHRDSTSPAVKVSN